MQMIFVEKKNRNDDVQHPVTEPYRYCFENSRKKNFLIKKK